MKYIYTKHERHKQQWREGLKWIILSMEAQERRFLQPVMAYILVKYPYGPVWFEFIYV